MGNTEIIKNGVQVMSAGTEVKHGEFNPTTTKNKLVQIWVSKQTKCRT
jgi:redox-sensitive bicupin YhaK (pirin superfamily)